MSLLIWFILGAIGSGFGWLALKMLVWDSGSYGRRRNNDTRKFTEWIEYPNPLEIVAMVVISIFGLFAFIIFTLALVFISLITGVFQNWIKNSQSWLVTPIKRRGE